MNLQYHGGNPESETTIVIGLDFGTSSTKICFRDDQRIQSYLIDFGQYSQFKSAPYLMQTTLYYRTKEQVFSLIKSDESDRTLRDLKVRLMEGPGGIDKTLEDVPPLSAEKLVSAYLGLVLKLARFRFGKQFGNQFSKIKILWELNLGIPSPDYDDNELKESYRKIGLAAWELSRQAKLFGETEVTSAWRSIEQLIENPDGASGDSLHPDQVTPIPEVVAGAFGYAKSESRDPNEATVHLLIDIGATTVDVATLHLNDKRTGRELDRYSLITTAVEHLGAYELARHRLNNFVHILKKKAQVFQKKTQSLLEDTDTMTPASIPESFELSIKRSDVDQLFMRKYREQVFDSIKQTKREQKSIVYQEHIPLLFSGGGTRIPEYRQVLTPEQLDNLKQHNIPEPYPLRFDNFEDLKWATKEVNFDSTRIGIAYGLSFTFDDIGKIFPTHHKLPSSPLVQYESHATMEQSESPFPSWRHDR